MTSFVRLPGPVRSIGSLRSAGVAAALASVFAIVIIGSTSASGWLADHLLAGQARSTADSWAKSIADALPPDAASALPEALSPEEAALLAAGRRAGGLVAFRIYGSDGRERTLLRGTGDEPTLDAALTGRVLAGKAVVSTVSSGPANAPRVTTRVLTPLASAGAARGVVEIEIDQTSARSTIISLLQVVSAGVFAVGLTAFGLPFAAFLRGRRRNREAQQTIDFLARHDGLTGLDNRAEFTRRVAEVLRRDARAPLAIVYLDLERVQIVNDLFGHEEGDGVILSVAADLKRLAGESAFVARLGGGEFSIARLGERPDDTPEAFARRLIDTLSTPRVLRGQEIALSASIGIALAKADDDAPRLLKNAHLALTHAKSRGGGAFAVFDQKMDDDLRQRRALETRVRDAAASNAFDLHFQPVFHVRDGRLTGFEALLRLPSDGGGFVSPALFVPIAEEIGLISQIGNWVIRRACAFASEWPGSLSVAVNLSPAQFKDGEVCRVVREALAETGLAPHRLELEITEGLLMSDADAIIRELGELKAMGVSIVMDDFGTGYSSLSYLWKFPFDRIKIDRSFMRALDESDSHVADILRAIMSLSRSLRLRVTAEGVETQAQAEFLRVLACDEVQGFLFGRPMPMTDVAATILNNAAEDGIVGAKPIELLAAHLRATG